MEAHVEAENNLEALCERTFDGPSGVGFEEGTLEELVKDVQAIYDQAQAQFPYVN